MSKEVPKRTFNVSLSPTNTTEIAIAEPDVSADNLALITWNSSFILANQLHKLDVQFEENNDIPILEIGAGTGLVGLAAAVLWRKQAILTDLPGIVPALGANVDLNATALKEAGTNVQCGTLDWHDANTLQLADGTTYHADSTSSNRTQKKASVILAADTIYDEDHPELLRNVILTWLAKNKSARLVICYAMRVAYLDHIREIWRMLEEDGLESVGEGQVRADSDDWDDECLCEWVVWRWKEVSD